MSDERTEQEMKATLQVLQPVVEGLRSRGYDASLWVERREDHLTVEIHIRIPPIGVPIEVKAKL